MHLHDVKYRKRKEEKSIEQIKEEKGSEAQRKRRRDGQKKNKERK
jgi:hypothetical protein